MKVKWFHCLQGKNPVAKDGKACAASREKPALSVDQEEYYIPSVDLLTAQVIICSHHATVQISDILLCRLVPENLFRSLLW